MRISDDTLQSAPRYGWLAALLALIVLADALGFRGRGAEPLPARRAVSAHPSTDGENRSEDGTRSGGTSTEPYKFPTIIRRPTGPPLVELGQTDPQGRAAQVACSTCHSIRKPNLGNRTPADLKSFHQKMSLEHGKLACYACHNTQDADTLRLADSTAVEFSDVMTLCAQCHGPQARDYAHGAHGGMTGYWDLSRGPRTRNNCIDCHDPHVPKFPSMTPTFKPRDRFLSPTQPTEGEFHSE